MEDKSIVVPQWYIDLRAWRIENNCVGPYWDAFAVAAQNRVKMTKYYFLVLGIMLGLALAYVYSIYN